MASLQDSMLDAIMRAALKRPKQWPKRLVSTARRYRNTQANPSDWTKNMLYGDMQVWNDARLLARFRFEQQVVRLTYRLPEFMREDAE